jgi:hypothetical protein
LLSLGRHETLLDLIRVGLQQLASTKEIDRVVMLDLLGARALVHLHRGELIEAREAADEALAAVRTAPRRYFAVLGMSAAAETYLALWEADGISGSSSETAAKVWEMCKHIDRYARISPPSRARALLWRGCAEWLGGSQKAARTAWRNCLREAHRFELPYETARTHYELGRRLDASDPERRKHLAQAEDGFRRLKCDADLRRLAVVDPLASPVNFT